MLPSLSLHRHEFHKKCVDPWLKLKRTCPICKHNITNDNRRRMAAGSTSSISSVSSGATQESSLQEEEEVRSMEQQQSAQVAVDIDQESISVPNTMAFVWSNFFGCFSLYIIVYLWSTHVESVVLLGFLVSLYWLHSALTCYLVFCFFVCVYRLLVVTVFYSQSSHITSVFFPGQSPFRLCFTIEGKPWRLKTVKRMFMCTLDLSAAK